MTPQPESNGLQQCYSCGDLYLRAELELVGKLLLCASCRAENEGEQSITAQMICGTPCGHG